MSSWIERYFLWLTLLAALIFVVCIVSWVLIDPEAREPWNARRSCYELRNEPRGDVPARCFSDFMSDAGK